MTETVSDQANVADFIQDESGRIFLYYTGWTVGEFVALDPDFDAMCAAADNFIADHPNALKKLGE